MYLDAKATGGAISVGSTAMATTTALNIGSRSYTRTSFFNGTIDEVKIYSSVLTQDQVKAEYNQGKAQVMGAGSTGLGGTTPSNSSSRAYCVPGDSSTCNAPLAEWKMDEGVGGTANDTSGTNYANFASGNSAPSWANGIFGNGINFGGDDWIDATSTIQFDSGNFTISGWFKSGATGVNDQIWNSGYNGGNTDVEIIYHSTNTLRFYIRDSTGADIPSTNLTSLAAVNDNKWHYFSTVRSSNTFSLYVDGKLNASYTQALGDLDTAGVIPRMGNGLATINNRHFTGLLDQMRVYTYARTPAQIAWEYNKGAPVAHYKLDECEGTTAYNSARTFNDAPAGTNGLILAGNTSGSNDSVGTCSSGAGDEMWDNGTTGKRNASLDFDGTNDYIDLQNSGVGVLSATGDWTISTWAKAEATSSNVIFSQYVQTAGNGRVLLRISDVQTTKYELFLGDDNSEATVRLTANTPITLSSWMHLVLTRNSKTFKMYINGKEEATYTDSGTRDILQDGNIIGARSGGGLYNQNITSSFNGQIDDVKIFNYALTPAQIKMDYSVGAVAFE